MVFCGLFPIDTDDYPDLRDALEKLALNDAALSCEPETSDALGFGFRCGFLGLLHMEIVRSGWSASTTSTCSRRRRTSSYEVDARRTATIVEVDNPTDMPDPSDDRARSASRTSRAIDPHADGVRRRDHGAVPGAARHARRHALPVAPTACSSTTSCRSPRSCSTSTTS